MHGVKSVMYILMHYIYILEAHQLNMIHSSFIHTVHLMNPHLETEAVITPVPRLLGHSDVPAMLVPLLVLMRGLVRQSQLCHQLYILPKF